MRYLLLFLLLPMSVMADTRLVPDGKGGYVIVQRQDMRSITSQAILNHSKGPTLYERHRENQIQQEHLEQMRLQNEMLRRQLELMRQQNN